MDITFSKNGILLEKAPKQFLNSLFAISLANRKYWIPFNKDNLLKLSKVNTIAQHFLDKYDKIPLATIDREKYPYLRDYQYLDVCRLINMPNHVNFSEMRCGKTLPTLVWGKETKLLKLLVVAPKSVIVLTWEQEINKWFPEWKVFKAYAYTGQLSKLKRSAVYEQFINEKEMAILLVSKDTIKLDITGSSQVHLLGHKLTNFGLIIDEATFLKNYKTIQSKTLKYISKYAKRISCLTGTPTPKHPMDIYSIMSLIEPSTFRSYYNLAEYFFGVDYWGSVETSFRSAELKQQWINWLSTFGVRHTQKEVMKWLPSIERVDIPVNLEKAQLKQYLLMQDQFMLENNSRVSNSLAQYTHLKLISNSPYGTKKDFIIGYLDNAEEEVIMIVSQYSDKVLKPLAEFLDKKHILYGLLIGETSLQDRVKVVNNTNNKQYKVLLANRSCIKEGVKLPGVDTLIWFDKGTLADNQQVEARFLPTTESEVTNSKKIISLITCEAVDENIEEQLAISNELNSFLENFGKDQ